MGAIFFGGNFMASGGGSFQGAIFLGDNYPREELSGGEFSLGAIILGGNCSGDNFRPGA